MPIKLTLAEGILYLTDDQALEVIAQVGSLLSKKVATKTTSHETVTHKPKNNRIQEFVLSHGANAVIKTSSVHSKFSCYTPGTKLKVTYNLRQLRKQGKVALVRRGTWRVL